MAKNKISNIEVQQEIYNWIKIVVFKTLKDKNISHLDNELLISAGLYGYTQARQRFDPTKGAKFKTYVEHRIRGAILDEVRKMIGDERRKTPLPKKVYDYNFEQVGDDSQSQRNTEGHIDLKMMWSHVKYSLSDVEIKLLQYRVEGHTFGEIAKLLDVKEKEIAKILNKVKKDVGIYFQDYIDENFHIKEYVCNFCKETNEMQKDIKRFDCEYCGRTVKVR